MIDLREITKITSVIYIIVYYRSFQHGSPETFSNQVIVVFPTTAEVLFNIMIHHGDFLKGEASRFPKMSLNSYLDA